MAADPETIDARHRIAIAGGVALLVAGLVLVMFVLPAEFAVDPLGTGARFGLLELGATGQQVAALETSAAAGTSQAALIVPQERPFTRDEVMFTLGPGESIEYKYRLEKGESLLYSWTASGPVSYEFHAEPDGAPRGYAQSYEKGDGQRAMSGTLTAPFSGIHGWYWANGGREPVTVALTGAGFFTLAHEFRANEPVRNKTFDP